MIVTQVDAHVEPSRWELLRRGYKQTTTSLEPQIVRTYLLQGTLDKTLWRIMTVWVSQEALDEYRQSVKAPAAMVLFQSVGAEPIRAIFEVVEFAP